MPILKDFTYHAPTTVKQALALLKKREALVLAGGTFLLNTLKKTAKVPTDVVSLRRIRELVGIQESRDHVSIGTMTTLVDVAGDKVLAEYFPALVQACRQIATTPIRNMATIGGNIASRFFWVDLPAVLWALDAKLVLQTALGKKVMSVEVFLTKKPTHASVLAEIILPKRACRNFYFRHTRAMEVDIPSAALAFSACVKDGRLSGVRCVVNTALSIPASCPSVAQTLEGKKVTDVSVADMTQAFVRDSAGFKADAYKIQLLTLDLEEVHRYLSRP